MILSIFGQQIMKTNKIQNFEHILVKSDRDQRRTIYEQTIYNVFLEPKENGRCQDMHVVDEIAPETQSPIRRRRPKCKRATV